MRTPIIALLVFATNSVHAETLPYEPDLIPEGYSVETIVTPVDENGEPLSFGVGGIGFTESGKAYVASRNEGIWKYENDVWTRFSDHIHDPQGIHVLDENTVVVAQKPELTLVRDTNGDGFADLYKTISDAWRSSGNYCEYVHGPIVDSEGNYYLNFNLGHGEESMMLKSGAPAMGSAGGYDGWHCKITPEGEFTPLSSGLRSPAGLGINPKNDERFYTENQGGWVGTSYLAHLEDGAFYSYPASLIDHADFRGDLDKMNDFEEFSKIRKLPAVWLPHGELANSPGDPLFNFTEGKFGPFEGQIILGCQTRSNIMRVTLEKVQGEYQGAVFNFVDHLQSGCMRIEFDAQGRLWIGQIGRGWRSKGGKAYGLQRLTWDGKTTPFEMKDLNLTRDGFKVTFTRPVDRESLTSERIRVSSWHYYYHAEYGSPKVDQKPLDAELLSISEDGLEATFKTPLETEKIYMITLDKLRSESDQTMSNNIGYYTINNLIAD